MRVERKLEEQRWAWGSALNNNDLRFGNTVSALRDAWREKVENLETFLANRYEMGFAHVTKLAISHPHLAKELWN